MTVESTFDPYEAAALSLREKRARLLAEVAAIDKSLAAIEAAREAAGTPTHSSAERPTPASIPITAADKFKGMGLGEAAATQLSEYKGIELTAKQIWAVLSRAGFSILSDRPEGAVNWALRKREKKEGDVVLVGNGKWGMVDWYSPEKVAEYRANRNVASGRNHSEHVEKTKAGIANAMQTRLRHWGRRRTITGDQMAAAYYAFQRGAKSKLALAKAANMAWPTFNLYWREYEMENWRPNDAFPPPRRKVVKENSEIRLESMWPREEGHANGHSKNDGPQLSLQPAE